MIADDIRALGHEIREKRSQMNALLRAAMPHAEDSLQALCLDVSTLRALKRELRRFDITTGRWK